MSKESKHDARQCHQTTREETKEDTERKYKTTRKQQNGNNYVYLSIISLNANGLNSLIKKHSMVEWIKNKTYYMLLRRDSLQM